MSQTETFHKTKFDNLDMVRGIAAFLVALCHFAPYGGYVMPKATGGLCVAYFFILSAFVLCHAYQDQIRDGYFSFKDFVGARIARVYPLHFLTFIIVALYWLVVTVAQKFGLPFNTVHPWRPVEILQNLTLTHLVFTGTDSYNTPSWSISVEFWCSLYVFFLCMPVRKIYKILSGSVLFLCYIPVIGIGGFLNAHEQHALGFLEKNYVTGAFLFFLGWALYHVYLATNARVKRINPLWAWGVVLALIAAVTWPPLPIEIYNFMELPYFLFITLTIYLLAFSEPKNKYIAATMREIGNMSFGIYLWHVPIMLGVTAVAKFVEVEFQYEIAKPLLLVVFCALVLVVSWISYRVYEFPAKIFCRRKLKQIL